ncbi:hypothetical protein PVAP13_7NG032000 [Panicum virgatum]|uniref:Uncharacterized protein n=1 Tax=Panicum virgatum TaxID=38727 RepID=A0A8T0PW87_PANVG|nr:hypothetical protein PVAP13_7NG032000 [Panicum virgatum]
MGLPWFNDLPRPGHGFGCSPSFLLAQVSAGTCPSFTIPHSYFEGRLSNLLPGQPSIPFTISACTSPRRFLLSALLQSIDPSPSPDPHAFLFFSNIDLIRLLPIPAGIMSISTSGAFSPPRPPSRSAPTLSPSIPEDLH